MKTIVDTTPKILKFNKLPKVIQTGMLESAIWQHNENMRKLKELLAHNRIMEELAYKDLEESGKYLICKHETVEHDTHSGITDNVVRCKICGFGWSDY